MTVRETNCIFAVAKVGTPGGVLFMSGVGEVAIKRGNANIAERIAEESIMIPYEYPRAGLWLFEWVNQRGWVLKR